LFLSGIIAATQSYYVVTFFCVRYCCPWLLKARPADNQQASDLIELARRGRIMLGITFSVPLVSVIAVLTLSRMGILSEVDDLVVLGALCALGLIGCGLAYFLDLAIRADLQALSSAVNPSSEPLADTTSDSFFTRSH